MTHTTHTACQEQLEKHGGKVTCCICADHGCQAVAYSTYYPQDSYDYRLGYDKAIQDVIDILPHDVSYRWLARVDGLRKV